MEARRGDINVTHVHHHPAPSPGRPNPVPFGFNHRTIEEMSRAELIKYIDAMSLKKTESIEESVSKSVLILKAQLQLRNLPPDSRIEAIVDALISNKLMDSNTKGYTSAYLAKLPDSTLKGLYTLLTQSPEGSGPQVVAELLGK